MATVVKVGAVFGSTQEAPGGEVGDAGSSGRDLQWTYLAVYMILQFGDWLQGENRLSTPDSKPPLIIAVSC